MRKNKRFKKSKDFYVSINKCMNDNEEKIKVFGSTFFEKTASRKDEKRLQRKKVCIKVITNH